MFVSPSYRVSRISTCSAKATVRSRHLADHARLDRLLERREQLLVLHARQADQHVEAELAPQHRGDEERSPASSEMGQRRAMT